MPNEDFDLFVFLLAAELEFRQILLRLGYSDLQVETVTVNMTNILCERVRELQQLWDARR